MTGIYKLIGECHRIAGKQQQPRERAHMKHATPIRAHLADMLASHVPYITSLENLTSETCTEVFESLDMEMLIASLHSWGLLEMDNAVPLCGHMDHKEDCLHCRCVCVSAGWCEENIMHALADLTDTTLITVYALVSGYVRTYRTNVL